MKCIKFVSLIPKYFDDDLAINVKGDMDNHIANCNSCRKKLEDRKKFEETFKYVLSNEEVNLKSRKDEILNKINKSRYTGKIANKTFYRLYFKRGTFIGVAAAVILIFITFKYGENIYNAAMQSTTMTEKNAVIEPSSEKLVPTVNSVISSTVKINFNDISKELLNPTRDVISASVNTTSRKKLVEMLNKMKQLPQGVGPWRTIYCNNGKMMVYNYGHMIAYNYTEKEKGIYSILDFSNLKVGSYQGSEVITFSISPDGNYVLFGTFVSEIDLKSDKSLYIYDVNNGTVKEIVTNFKMQEKAIWYNKLNDSSSKWIVSAKDDKNVVIWDVDKSRTLGLLPIDVKEILDTSKFLNSEDLNFKDDKGNITKLVTKNYTETFWFKDNNTLIAVQSIENMDNLKLMDFQIVEININTKTGKVTFRP